LAPKKPKVRAFWNKVFEEVKEQVVCEALEQMELSPRELVCRITETKEYFISESSVYRILKSHDLTTSPTYILMQAGDSFKNPTGRTHELRQTDFTYFRIVGWG
jgi:putative transposase